MFGLDPADVAGLSGERGDLRLAEPLASCRERLVRTAVTPIQLIDRPGRQVGFLSRRIAAR
jgi:hypothetical protein